MRTNDFEIFGRLCKMSQKQILSTVSTYLRKHYSQIIETKDYIYAVGDIPVALIAHCDTVFSTPPEKIYWDSKENIIWSPAGLGADDRAGVFGILKILRDGFRPSVIFTTEEERGSLGAIQLIKDIPAPLSDLKYLIQLDRRGKHDCVFYNCDNTDFIEYVESFGFYEAIGSFTDISELCPAWKIAGVNLSIGYFDEHTTSETFNTEYFENTLRKVIRMLKASDSAKHYEYIESIDNYGDWFWRKYIQAYTSDNLVEDYCEKCYNICYDFELFPVVTADGTIKKYCPDCITDKIDWCEKCGRAFEVADKEKEKICLICEKEANNDTKGTD